jgi:hypothetical protein
MLYNVNRYHGFINKAYLERVVPFLGSVTFITFANIIKYDDLRIRCYEVFSSKTKRCCGEITDQVEKKMCEISSLVYSASGFKIEANKTINWCIMKEVARISIISGILGFIGSFWALNYIPMR